MATGNEILAYTGSAELGSGSNPDIPVMDTAALEKANSIVSDTAKNLLLMNHENNLKLYNQKIADRDKQLEMLEKGEIATGEILDRDRPVINSLKEQSRKKFDEMIANGGINNQQAYKDYLDANQEFKDAVTHAQHRQIGSTGIDAEIAKETIPYKRDQLIKWKKEQEEGDAKDFWGNYGVYGQAFDRTPDFFKTYLKDSLIGGSGIQPTTSTTQKVVTGPKGTTVTETTKPNTVQTAKGIIPIQGDILKEGGKTYEVTSQHYDYNKILNSARTDYLKPSGKETAEQDTFLNDLSNASDATSVPFLNHLVDRWNKYQSDLGIVKGDSRYKEYGNVNAKENPIAIIDPKTGKKIINLSAPELTAMSALADIQGSYAPSSKKWLEDVDKFELEQQKVKDAKIKADKDRAERAQESKARIGLGYSELAETRRYHDMTNALPKNQQAKAEEITKEAIGYANDLMDRMKAAIDTNGNIDLSKLSNEDLNYLGYGKKEKGQFTLNPISTKTKLRVIDGEVYEVDDDGKPKAGGRKTPLTIAGNRLTDQLTSTTGTEGISYKALESLHEYTQKELSSKSQPKEIKKPEIKSTTSSGLPIFK